MKNRHNKPLPLLLTMCGSWMLAKLLMSDWLRLASSCSSESFCCSITLFSSSMDFRLVSMVVICQTRKSVITKSYNKAPQPEYSWKPNWDQTQPSETSGGQFDHKGTTGRRRAEGVETAGHGLASGERKHHVVWILIAEFDLKANKREWFYWKGHDCF